MAAASSKAAFFLLFNVLFFAAASACPPIKHPPPRRPPPPPPKPKVVPCPPPPAPATDKCPADTLKLGACADVFNGLINNTINQPPKEPCCTLLGGLGEMDAAVCLCTVIKANILGVTFNIPVDLSLVLNYCGKGAPKGYQCY